MTEKECILVNYFTDDDKSTKKNGRLLERPPFVLFTHDSLIDDTR